MTRFQKRLWMGLLIMALLTPLGILLPEMFKAEGAWGEWGKDELEKLLGYVPKELAKWVDLWKAPIPDYNFGGEEASMTAQVISYIASALLGIGVCALVVFLFLRLSTKHGK
jgi:cobalt/nickel transport protein